MKFGMLYNLNFVLNWMHINLLREICYYAFYMLVMWWIHTDISHDIWYAFRMIFSMHFAWYLVCMRVLLGKWTLIFCEECNMLYTLELGGECTHIICAKSCICFTHSSLAVQWMQTREHFGYASTNTSLLISVHWTLSVPASHIPVL